MGEESVRAFYERVRSLLEEPTPHEPFYMKAENRHHTESGEAALHFPQDIGEVAGVLGSLGNWCEILPLHINVKACTYDTDESSLTIYLGRKFYQDPDEAYQLTYSFETIREGDYFAAVAVADSGPLGTSDYHLEFEIIQVEDSTFGRIHISDHQSWISSRAMDVYLATKGADKQGISVIGEDEDGNPIYSSGEIAVAERNVLRYYFAFTAFLDSLDLPEGQRHDSQLEYWFDHTENYPQLHEMDKSEYLDEKRRERMNQTVLQVADE